jgi:hypothetical protein
MFCDLADSTALASRLDPEDLREVVRAYQQTCAAVIQRFDGHIAQYLGDGLLVYFGYPHAHEDDPLRAVHAGLEIVEAMRVLNTRLEQTRGIRLAVRLGIHTGQVVVGEMGGGGRHEQLALGETLNLAQTLAHPYTLAMAQFWVTTLHHHRRDTAAVQAQANALLTLATTHRFPLHVGNGTYGRGWVLAVQGEGTAGLAQLRQGLATVLATGQERSRPRCLLLLAEAAGHVGEVEEGLCLLTEALTVLEGSGQGDMLAEAYRLHGVLLLRQTTPDAAQAEACFQQALVIARRQQAKSWELRVAMHLSRLWQSQGKRSAAYELLAPIYRWFTEGFDTADLQEAKALLEELA